MIAGSIMEVGGISRRLIDFCDSLVGWAPGGLAAAAIGASIIIAGISGSAAADTAAIGAVVIPTMIRQGYPPAFAAAVVAAGGAIGIIIPPSIPMILFGFMTNISTSQLFAGGLLVGLLLGVTFMLVAILISWRRGYGQRRPFTWKRTAENRPRGPVVDGSAGDRPWRHPGRRGDRHRRRGAGGVLCAPGRHRNQP